MNSSRYNVRILLHSSQFRSLALFALLLVCGRVNGDAECIPRQRSLLLDLKDGFVMPWPDSRDFVSWRPGSDCCKWKGIACDPQSGHVVGLDLGGLAISGRIDSDALFGLTSLRTLDLSGNQFGEIGIPQPGFEKLKELRRLNLSGAGFVGQVPIGISGLAELEYLDLSDCDQLLLQKPDFHTLIRNLSNLRELHLDTIDLNQDAGWSTALLTSAPRLRKLSLTSTNIVGSFDKEFFQLKDLEYLDLSMNLISGVLPDFPKGCSLQRLYLSNTNISGVIPDSFGNLKNLTVFHMVGHFETYDGSDVGLVTGELPSSIGGLTQLINLDLSYNNLIGAIPTSIGSLTQLDRLDLSNNNITGAIPSSIGKLATLTVLQLTGNGLTGPIPVSLFSLPSLQSVFLGDNQLSGELGRFLNASTSLKDIFLFNNQLSGPIPPSFFYLPSLETLRLESNHFSGAIELDKTVIQGNLTVLDLSGNMLSLGEFNDNNFPSFPQLQTLSLASCGLTKVPTFLKNQGRMQLLDLSNNRIGGDIPTWMWMTRKKRGYQQLNLSYNSFTSIEGSERIPMGSLNMLDLRSNKLQGPLPLLPPSVRYVDLSNNNFSSTISPEFLSNLDGAEFFSAANNNLTGEISPSICKATPLIVLDLSRNSFGGSIPSCLLEHPSLQVLNLGGNQLEGTVPQNATKVCQLKSIILSSNHLEGPLPRSLVNCSNLEVLDIGNNRVVDSFPSWLGDHVQLQVLSLKANRFYGPLGPSRSHQENCTFPYLQIFDLSSNRFHGNLSPKCFGGLSVMMNTLSRNPSPLNIRQGFPSTFYQNNIIVIKGQQLQLETILKVFYTVVDLSNNSFKGDIPEVIGELRGLHVLNLSRNSLTGKIPFELGDLIELQSLDLSANHLSGEIPRRLISLTFLELLDLSYNNLVGRIPLGNQFSTFANASFLGNPGLCGFPLTEQCVKASPNTTDATAPAEISDHSSSRRYVIGLALSIGIGYGVGIALVFMLQTFPLKFWKKTR